MIPAPAPRPGSPAAAAGRIEQWRRELSAHSGPNTLLWADPAVILDITHAHPGGLAKLLAGRTTRLSELYREAATRLRAVARARVIHATYLDLARERGLPGSYLAIGRATWTERRGPRPSAPIFLRRAILVPHDARLDDFDVVAIAEPEFNPALRSFLESTGGGYLPFEDLVSMSIRPHGFDPARAYAALSQAWPGPPGWSIAADLWLTTFGYSKLSTLADFHRLATGIPEHPVLGPLARGSVSGPVLGQVGTPADPELTTVLDADPDQIAVLEAVRAGGSVVLDAGPGTGKSQTIINVLADQARQGRRTLVVAASADSRRAISGRLGHVGLGGLLTEPGSDRAPGGRRPGPPARVQSDWSSAGPELRDHMTLMHRPRMPWGISLDQVQERIAGVCARAEPPRSKVRLSGADLSAMGPEELREWTAVLQDAAADGAWPVPGAPADPWWGAAIGEGAAASRAEVSASALSAEAFAAFETAFRATFEGISVPPLRTLGEYGAFIDGMARLRSVLDLFRLGIFEAPLEDWTSAGGGAFDRWKHDRAIRALIRPGGNAASAQALVVEALAVRPLWHQVRGSRIMPGQVQGIATIQQAYARLAQDADFLTATLAGEVDLFAEPLPHLHARMAHLRATTDRLATLARVNPQLDRARAAGLSALIEDLAQRRVAASEVGAELEFAWLASVLATVTAADPAYARAGGDQLRAARSRFRDVDRSVQAAYAADLARAAAASGSSVVLTSPYAVGLHVQADDSFDLVVVDDAQALTAAEAAGALTRAPQALIVGDSRLPGPQPFTATAGGALAPDPGSTSLLAEAAALWPVLSLSWHYRSQDPRLIEPVLRGRYDAGRTFPTPHESGGYRIEAVPLTDPDQGPADQALLDQAVRIVLTSARLRPSETLAVVTLVPDLAERIGAALAATMDSSVAGFFADDADEPVVITDAAHATGLVRDAVVLVLGPESLDALATPAGAALLTAGASRARARLTVLHTLDMAQVRAAAQQHPAQPGIGLLARLLEPGQLPSAILRSAAIGGGQGQAASPTDPQNPSSMLLDDLARRLKARGLSVRTAVAPGIVDLAVADPFSWSQSGLAVQVDGPAYAALGSMRMRDRLVQEQLLRLGWRPLKILTVDLFRDPAREEARIVSTMERIAAGDTRTGPISRPRRARRPATGGASGSSEAGQPAPELEQTRDDTDAGWGEAAGGQGDPRDRWIAENRPPHWG